MVAIAAIFSNNMFWIIVKYACNWYVFYTENNEVQWSSQCSVIRRFMIWVSVTSTVFTRRQNARIFQLVFTISSLWFQFYRNSLRFGNLTKSTATTKVSINCFGCFFSSSCSFYCQLNRMCWFCSPAASFHDHFRCLSTAYQRIITLKTVCVCICERWTISGLNSGLLDSCPLFEKRKNEIHQEDNTR